MKFVLSLILITIGLVAGRRNWDRRVDENVVSGKLTWDRRYGNEMCKGEKCQCSTHTDCPPSMNCYTDFTCREPCLYSVSCGIAAKCSVVEKVPSCHCPPGFEGDEHVECFPVEGGRRNRYNY